MSNEMNATGPVAVKLPEVADAVLGRFRAALLAAGLEPYEFTLTWEPPVPQRLHKGDHEVFGACILRINSEESVEILCRKLQGVAD